MVMWADHVEKSPAMLRHLPKDIVLCHWQYVNVRPELIRPSLRAGFDVILAPAILHYGKMIQPAASNLANLDAMLAAGRRLGRRGVLGVVDTFWTARRIVRDAATPALAYAGLAMAAGKALDKEAFFRRFCRQYLGSRSVALARALWAMHRLTLSMTEVRAGLFDSLAGLHQAAELAGGEAFPQHLLDVEAACDAIRKASGTVTRHVNTYRACLLAARTAETCLRQAADARRALQRLAEARFLACPDRQPSRAPQLLRDAANILHDMEQRLAELADALDYDWDLMRFPDDPGKFDDPAVPCPCDHLLGNVVRARPFLRRLADRADRAARAYQPGDVLPSLL